MPWTEYAIYGMFRQGRAKVGGETKVQPRMAPDVGQNTRAILEACGLSEAEIAALGG